ncbi:hypothetical protein BJF95_07815 [Rhizobium oryziradicis]|uniref:Uncharacterized protein n=1 Tax=Rhizobium oryziradicis TaxID=1867956 RepID=A0A1Q8ZR03_9HYPH|nr:hypothetical protein BJF95_07815 [Rhizobium oryziradicis]
MSLVDYGRKQQMVDFLPYLSIFPINGFEKRGRKPPLIAAGIRKTRQKWRVFSFYCSFISLVAIIKSQ